MENKISKLIDDTLELKLRSLTNIEYGSDEWNSAIEEIAQLHKMRMEEAKIEVAKAENHEERENRKEQQKSQRIERIINVVMQGCIAAGGWLLYDVWNKRVLRFEEHGSIGSQVSKNLFSKIVPRIKN